MKTPVWERKFSLKKMLQVYISNTLQKMKTPATQEESPRVGEKELQKVSKPDMKTMSHVIICREEGSL